MDSLRSAVIRLAHAQPKLRKVLVPILRQAVSGEYGKPVTGQHIRYRWVSHPANRILIEELPGKPVKKRVRRMEVDTSLAVHHINGSSAFLMSNIMRDLKLTPSMSYEQAVKALKGAIDGAVTKTIAETAEAAKKYPGRYVALDKAWFKRYSWPYSLYFEQEVSYLEVEPADYQPITFKGKDFNGIAEWTKFRFYADANKDEFMQHMEGMQAFYDNKSAGAARKLFKLLKPDPDIVKGMKFGDFKAWLDRNKVSYSYNPTVWR